MASSLPTAPAKKRKRARGPAASPTSAYRLAIREKQERAFQFRLSGMPFAQIAQQVGYSDAAGALRAVQAILATRTVPEIDEYRKVTMARHERVLQSIWPAVLRGDEKILGRYIQLLDQMNKLMGAYPLNPALVAQVTVETANDETIVGVGISWTPDDEWMRKFAAAWSEVHPDYVPALETTDGATGSAAPAGDPGPPD
jgi:hypothetical protein